MGGRKDFWNAQYKDPTHLTLSDEAAEDLQKFCRYLERRYGRALLNVTTRALDMGCGNGRNLIYLSKEFGMHGLGYDTSKEAVLQARATARELPLKFEVRSLTEPIPLPDSSVTLALDMMSSHVLKRAEREALLYETLRVLRPKGCLFFKTFILEEDLNAQRMLRDYPGPEEGMYIHPELGHAEYVWTVKEIKRFFGDFFTIHKIDKSHKHRHADGSAWKRRTASVYLEKTS